MRCSVLFRFVAYYEEALHRCGRRHCDLVSNHDEKVFCDAPNAKRRHQTLYCTLREKSVADRRLSTSEKTESEQAVMKRTAWIRTKPRKKERCHGRFGLVTVQAGNFHKQG